MSAAQQWADALCDSADRLYGYAVRFDADLPRSRAIRLSADALHDKSEAYRRTAERLRAQETVNHV